jgi:DHA2 family methylenomycin A resistance protein-like MFS transporter
VFVPMMVTGAVLTPVSPRIVERLGVRAVVSSGLVVMTVGLVALATVSAATPIGVLAAMMMLVVVAGPLTIPPITAVLLNSVAHDQAGTASGVFNTSRQIGGALAVAVFGTVLDSGNFIGGLRTSFLIAAAIAAAAAAASSQLRPTRNVTFSIEAMGG